MKKNKKGETQMKKTLLVIASMIILMLGCKLADFLSTIITMKMIVNTVEIIGIICIALLLKNK